MSIFYKHLNTVYSIINGGKIVRKKAHMLLKAAVVVSITLAFMIPGSADVVKNKQISTTPINIVSSEPVPVNTASALFQDDFESYDDFALEFPPWTQFDGDEQQTWGFQTTNFTNEYYFGAFIIFVPSMTDPPLSSDTAHSGLKYAACFDAVPTDILNDDWMITPALTSGGHQFYAAIHCVNHDSFWLGIDDFAVDEVQPGTIEISFWAKTGSPQYEKDRFQVGVSTTTNSSTDFVIISPEPYVQPPTSWTHYNYTVELGGVTQPELAVSIAGGLGVTATITNSGDANATNCVAAFNITGGLIFVPSGRTKTVTVGTIAPANATGTAKTMVVGFGKPTITVTVTCDEGVTASTIYKPKFLLFFFLIG
jgi:hypothetical protein